MTLALTLKGCHQLLNLRKQVIVLPHMQDRSLKLTFQQNGYAVFISTQTPNGGHLPFAAQVFNQNNEVVGMVAQGSRIYLRTP